MRFLLIDRITDCQPGVRLEAVKNLTLGEEYLADHFPTFPVMPGVLMLEALVQAGAWLVRVSDDFAHSVVVAREVKGVKYGSFMEPGHQLILTVEAVGSYNKDSPTVAFKGSGQQGGTTVVSARFTLERYRLQDRRPDLAAVDDRLTGHYRLLYEQLRPRAAE
jgi:3-hydroxyacyl-[acyl-carrier-protein] dehydratase